MGNIDSKRHAAFLLLPIDFRDTRKNISPLKMVSLLHRRHSAMYPSCVQISRIWGIYEYL